MFINLTVNVLFQFFPAVFFLTVYVINKNDKNTHQNCFKIKNNIYFKIYVIKNYSISVILK